MIGNFLPVAVHKGVLVARKYSFMHSTASRSRTCYLDYPQFKSISEDQLVGLAYFLTSPKTNSDSKLSQIRFLTHTFLCVIHSSSCHLAPTRNIDSDVKQTTNKIHSFLNSALDEGDFLASSSGHFTPDKEFPVSIE
jgi:hypothetical protein